MSSVSVHMSGDYQRRRGKGGNDTSVYSLHTVYTVCVCVCVCADFIVLHIFGHVCLPLETQPMPT